MFVAAVWVKLIVVNDAVCCCKVTLSIFLILTALHHVTIWEKCSGIRHMLLSFSCHSYPSISFQP